jgi:hypothetical protein
VTDAGAQRRQRSLDGRRFHSTSVTTIYALLGFGFAAATVSLAFVDGRNAGEAWFLGLVAVIASAMVAVGVRGLLAGIYTGVEGLRVRNLLRTYDFEWEQVEGLALESFRGMARLRLRNGRELTIHGIADTVFEGARHHPTRDMVEELDRIARQRRSSGP